MRRQRKTIASKYLQTVIRTDQISGQPMSEQNFMKLQLYIKKKDKYVPYPAFHTISII